MSKRKSIVSSFGDFASQSKPVVKEAEVSSDAKEIKPKTRVGAGIIGATKRSLTELREERDQLLASVQDGDVVLMLDPALIEPSPFNDRLPDDDDQDFDNFKETLKDEGQKVPITVRRHPTDPTRYQTVYGHRRTRALRELNMQVEAILRDYSDRDLLVAQGIENASRQDLSWIEKAMFASTMEQTGLKPKEIKSALSVDDAQISKFRSVYNALGLDVIKAIGRAPKIGRPRWLDLVALVKSKSDLNKITKTLSSDKVLRLSSDERFLVAYSALEDSLNESSKNPIKSGIPLGEIGHMKIGKQNIKMTIEKDYADDFGAFLEDEMEALVSKFLNARKQTG